MARKKKGLSLAARMRAEEREVERALKRIDKVATERRKKLAAENAFLDRIETSLDSAQAKRKAAKSAGKRKGKKASKRKAKKAPKRRAKKASKRKAKKAPKRRAKKASKARKRRAKKASKPKASKAKASTSWERDKLRLEKAKAAYLKATTAAGKRAARARYDEILNVHLKDAFRK